VKPVLDVQTDGIPNVPQSLFVRGALGIAPLKLGTVDEISLFVPFKHHREVVNLRSGFIHSLKRFLSFTRQSSRKKNGGSKNCLQDLLQTLGLIYISRSVAYRYAFDANVRAVRLGFHDEALRCSGSGLHMLAH